MAGLHFGTSQWDQIPQTLGLTVEGGEMKGLWQGMPVLAYFTNRYHQQRETYDYFTRLRAVLDPPLGLQGLEDGEAMNRIVDPAFKADVEARIEAIGLDDLWFGDGMVAAEFDRYEEDPEKYRAAFDILTWAARIVMDRRAKNPPQWELAIGAAWPALARGWDFRLDVRRGLMEGTVRGRQTRARVVVEQGAVTTHVDVAVPLPPGATMALTRQKDGFFSKLFRGQDILVGDPAFDQTFVIKGEPEAFVRASLTPAAREQIMQLTQAGASIALKDGALAAWSNQLVTNLEHLDWLMKTAFSAAETLCPGQPPPASPVPYR
jgi:hypothetical protein